MSKKRIFFFQKELEDIVSRWDELLDNENFPDSDSDCPELSFCENLEWIKHSKYFSYKESAVSSVTKVVALLLILFAQQILKIKE